MMTALIGFDWKSSSGNLKTKKRVQTFISKTYILHTVTVPIGKIAICRLIFSG